MTDAGAAVELREARAEDAESIAAIWYAGWRDCHLGNVPDELVAIRPQESFALRAAQRIDDTTVLMVAGFDASATMRHVVPLVGNRPIPPRGRLCVGGIVASPLRVAPRRSAEARSAQDQSTKQVAPQGAA
ncbi:hypothetical protein ACLMAL_27365 [Nocardia sp. CWNU-33]|uniref:hypothetical protein n=1 Tax=Nocardia sp. CWNU-33 TaxID=3392117 RepID=UPI00398F171F